MGLDIETRLMMQRIERERDLRRAQREARLGPLPERTNRRRSRLGVAAAWFRRVAELAGIPRTVRPHLRG